MASPTRGLEGGDVPIKIKLHVPSRAVIRVSWDSEQFGL